MKKISAVIALLIFTCLTHYGFGQTNCTNYGSGTKKKGSSNSFFGKNAGYSIQNPDNIGYNSFFGAFSGLNTTTGISNTFIGQNAGRNNKEGKNNTYIGRGAGSFASANAEGNVFIGRYAGYNQAGSNKLIISNGPDKSLIYGEFNNNFVKINGHFQSSESITLKDGLYFSKSSNHSDGLPKTRIMEDWGVRFAAPTATHVLSSKNSVLVGYNPNGENYGDGNLFVQHSVGIGTVDPSTLFEINTGAKSNDNALARIVGEYNPGLEISSNTDAKPRILLKSNNGADKWEMNVAGNQDNRSLSFLYNNSNHLSLSKDGNVGIGTTNPDYRLDVEGTVKAENFVSSTASFPDYVFDKEYTLMPLMELESFVNENKHLPNMPSEKEVVEYGMDISEVTIKSVENIETIYLHLIEMKKEIEALKRENAELKTQIAQ